MPGTKFFTDVTKGKKSRGRMLWYHSLGVRKHKLDVSAIRIPQHLCHVANKLALPTFGFSQSIIISLCPDLRSYQKGINSETMTLISRETVNFGAVKNSLRSNKGASGMWYSLHLWAKCICFGMILIARGIEVLFDSTWLHWGGWWGVVKPGHCKSLLFVQTYVFTEYLKLHSHNSSFAEFIA